MIIREGPFRAQGPFSVVREGTTRYGPVVRSLRDLAETYGTSALALVCALVAALGWLVTHIAWAVVEALHGHSEARMPPAYLIPVGTLAFTAAAIVAGIGRLRRGR